MTAVSRMVRAARSARRGAKCAVFFLAIIIGTLASTSAPSLVRAQDIGPKLAPIQLTPERRQLIGLQIAEVREEDLVARIDATGLTLWMELLPSWRSLCLAKRLALFDQLVCLIDEDPPNPSGEPSLYIPFELFVGLDQVSDRTS